MTVRIGIVGAGANTKLRHIPGFQKIDDVEVVAVANRSRESSQKAADEFGIGRIFDTWEELVESDEVNAVCVGTWPYLHCPITLACLKAGKHILTEVSMIVPAPFYLREEQTLIDMIQRGDFGDLLEIQVAGLGGSWDPEAPLHWRQRRALSGNNIMTMGIFNETVRRYAGHEKSVTAFGKTFITERTDPETGAVLEADVPDSLGILAEHESGAVAVYHFSSVARLGRNATFEFYGTGGAFKLEGGKGWIALGDDKSFRELEVPPEKPCGWRVEEEFVEAIREGKPVTHTNFEDGVKYMEFTEAVQQSMREGRRIDLPL
ncbi:MAG: Gfo/Idh/MocA family oxidoreductase [Gammaproteobacteria bacterium]